MKLAAYSSYFHILAAKTILSSGTLAIIYIRQRAVEDMQLLCQPGRGWSQQAAGGPTVSRQGATGYALYT